MVIGAPVGGTNLSVSVATTTFTVPYPTGITSSMVLVMRLTLSSTTTVTTPSGWTAGPTNTGGGSSPRVSTFWRVATGSESGSLAVTVPSSTGQARIYRIPGVDLTNTLDAASTSFGSGATTAYNLPTITTVTNGALSFGLVGSNTSGSGTFTPPTIQGGYTELLDDNTQSHSSDAYALIATAGATGTLNFVRSGSVRGAGAHLVFRPASSGSTVNATAAGTQASTGTAVATVRHPATAAGAGAGTGSAVALVKHPATAGAAGAGTGSAVALVRHTATAAGTQTGTGSAVAGKIVRATAAGTQAGTGAAAATVSTGVVTVHATAVGVQAGTGTAAARVSHFATAAGTQSGAGAAFAVRYTYATASGTQSGAGSAVATSTHQNFDRVPVGAAGPRVPEDAAEARVPVDAAEARTPSIAGL